MTSYLSKVTEVQGRTYATKGVLLRFDSKTSTAIPSDNSPTNHLSLTVGSLLPVFRSSSSVLLGYGHVQEHAQALVFKIFLDFSSPERLELENGEKRYLELYGTDDKITHLEITSKTPSNNQMLPLGDSETELY